MPGPDHRLLTPGRRGVAVTRTGKRPHRSIAFRRCGIRPVLAENAVGIFSRTLLLPLRKPGATRPELLGARRVGAGRLG